MKNWNLRKLRTSAGLTQRELSVRTKIERSKLSTIEWGYTEPSPAEKKVIEKVLRAALNKKFSSLKADLATLQSPAASDAA